jgi:TonB-linked SusC/RagA family outer membrane protein
MTKKYSLSTCVAFIALFFASIVSHTILAQNQEVGITGVVTESGSGLPLQQVSISVSSTGTSTFTDEKGTFSVNVPNLQAEIIFNLPGYNIRRIYLNGRSTLSVSLISSEFKSLDDVYNTPLGSGVLKDQVNPTTSLRASDLAFSKASSFDQTLKGKAAGMSVTQQSGMPGQRTSMKIRGFSSLFGNSEPLLFIDGMIHDYSYANDNVSLMEGFALNPMDIIDVDDIVDITVQNDGLSYLGAIGSNGVININTEQKAEASTIIKFSAYGGISLAPNKYDVMNAVQYKGYFSNLLTSEGYSQSQIDADWPWLNGGSTSEGYYKYNNNTDWQDEVFRSAAAVQKYHFFLKGGDEIATYNISTGYLTHDGIVENSTYNRYNLRINGIINITDKFSVIPNAKLSLAGSKVANHGTSLEKNPILAAILKPSIMAPNARAASNGVGLPYLDDVGVFGISNPSAIVENAMGSNTNYHFLSSIAAKYKFNEHLTASTLFGISFNSARESIFIPDLGMVKVDSAANSPQDLVSEFRSTQNHSQLTYNNKFKSGHDIEVNAGFRYMLNSYIYNYAIDLNTPSDFVKVLGADGGLYPYLRTSNGDNRGLGWLSYFGNINYGFRSKYFLNANISYDGNSATNESSRYNLYPSVGAAWRVSSESFLNDLSWLDELKFRGSYSVTGNMYNSAYDFSRLYYTDHKLNNGSVLTREAIPNEDMELETKSSISLGLDLSLLKQLVNIHVDVYKSNVDNLIVNQYLAPTFGYTNYFDNAGKLESTGFEISADTRIQSGNFAMIVGGTVSKDITEIKEFSAVDNIITSVNGAQYITSVGNPINAFYGYKTMGVITSPLVPAVEGPGVFGGEYLQEGDMNFFDVDGNSKINEADKMIIGNPNPDFFGSVFTNISYKRFGLMANFNYSIGNDAFNFVKYQAESMSTYSNQSVEVLTNPTMPNPRINDRPGNTVFSDRWIEDASYIRLDQLTLNYNLPGMSGIFKGMNIYLTATNLLTISDYSGYDPEFAFQNNAFYMGADYGKMPQTKSFIVGVKLDL